MKVRELMSIMLTTAGATHTPMFSPEPRQEASTVLLGSPRERSTTNTPFRPRRATRQGTAKTIGFNPITPSILSNKKPAEEFDFNEA